MRNARELIFRFMRSSVFPHEEFILKAAKSPDSEAVTKLLIDELDKIIDSEEIQLAHLRCLGITREERITEQKLDSPSPRKKGEHTAYHSCEECGFDCYLSFVVCDDHPKHTSCLSHAMSVCSSLTSFRVVMDWFSRVLLSLATSTTSISTQTTTSILFITVLTVSQGCSCPAEKKKLQVRVSLDELREIRNGLQAK